MGPAMPLVGRSLAIFVVSIVMMSISVLVVSLRSFVRLRIVRAFGWDDGLMVAALALFILLNICCIIGSMNGIGHSSEDFTSTVTYKKALLWWWLGQMIYIWAASVAKISIALALLRLTIQKSHRIILWGLIGTVISIGLMFWLVLLFDCQPIGYFWHQVDQDSTGSCLPLSILLDIAYLYSSLTILCDLTLGILPAFLVWNLQMNRRTKLAVGGILSLGALASVAVMIRIPFLHFYADKNFLHSTFQVAIWSVIETGLGITAGSLITLRPLFRWLLDGTRTYNRNPPGPSHSRQYKYPLSSLKLGSSHDPSYWRPDLDPDDSKSIIITVSSPRRQHFTLASHSSEEPLYSELTLTPSRNQVTIQKTFEQIVTERPK
ncbi:uncharacterized protein N7511_001634 [Penicillium nucicola]|uniref:uncharacterized protein n=1 Tax=Penicillium nucicola TaxID=1850975 RepID=UPI0025453EE2|nr:uncharacterized protein N7511_001634 [Penicillium nucicola]KAJ5776623.1 hypothetical protein N7511_001634 [Penicillium nucicola]